MKNRTLAYAGILAGTVIWCALIAAAPLLASRGGDGLSEILYTGFHRVCHQFDSRSLHVFGKPLAVCSRCTAIYGAFLLGTLAYPIVSDVRRPRQPSKLLLGLALAPMVLDVFFALLGVHETSTLTRLVTGSVFGGLIPFVIIPVLLGAVREHPTTSPVVIHQSKGVLDG